MDVRDRSDGVLRRALGALDGFNARHAWSHNDHFHRWIVRRLPRLRCTALDVGCGRGALAELLAGEFASVDAVDADGEMVRACARRLADHPRVSVREARFEEVEGSFDVVTMVAVLHHLDLEAALRHVRELLAPGGRFLVVGLARPSTVRDFGVDAVSVLLNPVVGFAKHPRAMTPASREAVPVKDPELSFDAIRSVVRGVLPGARMRRRLFFRYTLEWTAPLPPQDRPPA